MAFETPITIKSALERIQSQQFVLPAIQREFVWKPTQICRLFDSLMRGYPIGSFLFWKVAKEKVRDYKFYGFIQNYHQRDNPHCPELDLLPDSSVVAILDGQQRLTAINIGLRGSHASKLHRMWWDNPKAFPEKKLYLNLLHQAPENEEGMKYDFRFLSHDEIKLLKEKCKKSGEPNPWFPVWKILDLPEPVDLNDWLIERNLATDRGAFRTLSRLQQFVSTDLVLAHYLEESQDLDKVLNIFIRTNSGGTVLSYSDLLLSIATAQWEQLDARKEIHGLVDELNGIRFGFAFSKDFVLKAGLMLANISSVGFRVTNFNRENMKKLETEWGAIRNTLSTTVRLVANFGFSGATLSADNSLLPIAYYLHSRQADSRYLHSSQSAIREDRERIKSWLIRALLKSGVWGSGLDTLLTRLRNAIRESGNGAFPIGALEQVLNKRGKALAFTREEKEDLSEIQYGDRRVFPLLALLFPFVDLRNEFHVDHIFPRAQVNSRRLHEAGVDPDLVDQVKDRANCLPNLELLEAHENESKKDTMPEEWLNSVFTAPNERDAFIQRHKLGEVPNSLANFNPFYEERRQLLLDRIDEVLGPDSVSSGGMEDLGADEPPLDNADSRT